MAVRGIAAKPEWVLAMTVTMAVAVSGQELVFQGIVSCRAQEQGEVNFFDPHTTHLIAIIEDFTKVLVGATEEMEDLEEETGESADSRPPAIVPLRMWQATSIQEWYMVDTPNVSNDDDPHYEPHADANANDLAASS